MWPFRRNRSGTPEAPGSDTATRADADLGGGGHDGGDVQDAGLAADPPAWTTLPALTPTVEPPASTFKIGAAVKDDLVALRSPRLAHGLGHIVSADGPAGLVSGLAQPAVQRRAEPGAGSSGGAPPAGASAPGVAGAPGSDLPLARVGAAAGDGGDGGDGGDKTSGAVPVVARRLATADAVTVPARPVESPAPELPVRDLPIAPTPAGTAAPAIQRQADDDAGPAPAERETSLAPPGGETGSDGDGDDAGLAGADQPSPATPSLDLAPPAGAAAAGPGVGDAAGAAGESPAVQRSVSGSDQLPSPPAGPGPGTTGGDPPVDLAIRQRVRGERPVGPDRSGEPPPVQMLSISRDPGGASQPPATPAGSGGGPGATGALSLPVVQRSAGADTAAGPAVAPGDGHGPGSSPAAGEGGLPGDVGSDLPLAADGHDPHGSGPGPDSDTGPAASDAPTGGEATGSGGLVGDAEPLVVSRTPIDAPPHDDAGPGDGAPADSPGGDAGSLPGLDLAAPPTGSARPGAGEAGGAGPAAGGHADAGPATVALTAQRSLDTAATTGQLAPAPVSASPAGPSPGGAPGVRPADPADPARAPGAAAGATVLPLALQRALAPTAAAVPTGRDTAGAAATGPDRSLPAPAAGYPTGGPGAATVQRWPDLAGARDRLAGGALDAARDRAGGAAATAAGSARDHGLGLVDRGRGALADAAGDPLALANRAGGLRDRADAALNEVVPGVPGAAGLPGLPSGVPDLPSGLPGVPSGLPGLPSGLADVPAAAAAVPMTEITFPSPAGEPAAAGASAGGAAPAAPAAPGGDLDELARKLYDRIRWRLRTELRLDMERAGLGAGVRR